MLLEGAREGLTGLKLSVSQGSAVGSSVIYPKL